MNLRYCHNRGQDHYNHDSNEHKVLSRPNNLQNSPKKFIFLDQTLNNNPASPSPQYPPSPPPFPNPPTHSFYADPDQGFFLNADPDPESRPCCMSKSFTSLLQKASGAGCKQPVVPQGSQLSNKEREHVPTLRRYQ